MRPGAMIRRWGPALLGFLLPVAGTFLWLLFRSPDSTPPPVRRIQPLDVAVVEVPAGEHLVANHAGWRKVETAGFWIGQSEVSVEGYCNYLNLSGSTTHETPQIAHNGSRWTPREGTARQAIAWVTAEEAMAFCTWLSTASGKKIRLPSTEEWEMAARADSLAEKAGGWKAYPGPSDKAPWADAPPENAWGLRGLNGSLFEWCRDGDQSFAMDIAWTEPTGAYAVLGRRWEPPPGYQDRDTGFRILVEAD